ncbi:MAG: site-specific integrase [Methylovulum sp.]|uniref:site-specific integrase n=3 Tax=Methylovulum sp. TaxID=1916980 RepID=UPI00261E3A82|nr:site-specific integrase [Methylovulum sp.]MDD2725589.1 site-specific integrase [Methylovulum sp.]
MDFNPPSYITKNRLGIYYFQLRVPKQFCQNNPHLPPLIRKSLGTRNRREALRLARQMVVLMENNNYLQVVSSIDMEADKNNQLFHIGKPLFEELERLKDEGLNLEMENFLINLGQLEEKALNYVIDENNNRVDIFSKLLSNMEHQKATDFYKETPAIFRKNLDSLRPAQLSIQNHPDFETINTQLQELTFSFQNQHKQHIKSIPLQEAFDKFIIEKKTNWKDDNFEQHYRSSIFALFYELIGDVKTGDLEKSHSILYKDAVLKIPSNRKKKKAYKAFTAKELMELDIPEEDQFSDRNKEKYLENLSGFLQWLQKNDLAIDNLHVPLQNIIKKSTAEHTERNIYPDEDLRKLFNSRQYCDGLHKEPFEFWVPLIGLLTGARENEICQLHLSDIYMHKETSIWVFDFNEDDSTITKKSIKKGNHARLVPIHKTLIDLGLLDFIETLKQKNKVRLFPELQYKGKNKYADKFQRWFNTTYTNAKNCNITTPNTSFHSLRHTFITHLANEMNIQPHQISTMVGQKPDGGVTVQRYIKPIDLEQRNNILKEVNFDKSIDFLKIKKWQHHRFAK